MGLFADIKNVFAGGSDESETQETQEDTVESTVGSVCDTCGKEFETENGANIHSGQVHAEDTEEEEE